MVLIGLLGLLVGAAGGLLGPGLVGGQRQQINASVEGVVVAVTGKAIHRGRWRLHFDGSRIDSSGRGPVHTS